MTALAVLIVAGPSPQPAATQTRAAVIDSERAEKLAELWPERQNALVDLVNGIAERSGFFRDQVGSRATVGSLDLYIRRASPGAEREPNWLPALKSGGFSMNMRLYWPRPAAVECGWAPPAIQRMG
jgi:hypothetical protein